MSNTTIPVKFKLGTNIDIAKNSNIEQGALYLEQKTNDFNLYFGADNLTLLPIYHPVRINDEGGVEIGEDAAALDANNVATSGVAIGKNAKTDAGISIGTNTVTLTPQPEPVLIKTYTLSANTRSESIDLDRIYEIEELEFYDSNNQIMKIRELEFSEVIGNNYRHNITYEVLYSSRQTITVYRVLKKEGHGVAIGFNASAHNGSAIGQRASATSGGAIGYNASSTSGFAGGEGAIAYSGAAIGNNAYANYGGGAVGNMAYSQSGGAVGSNANTRYGGVVGSMASSYDGGAVGCNANTINGGAIGQNALAINYKETATSILVGNSSTLNDIELSTSTMNKAQFYFRIDSMMYYGDGCIDNISYKSNNGKYLYTIVFKSDIVKPDSNNRNVTVYLIEDNFAGGAVGQEANTKTGGAIGYNASSTSGFAGGEGAIAYDGGAVGYNAYVDYGGGAVGCNAYSTLGGAIGNGASSAGGGAIGKDASSTDGGAVGVSAYSTTGFAGGQNAKATADGAVQLGEGTNEVANTLKFRDCQLMDANGYFITKKYGTSDPPSDVTTIGSIYYKIIS